MKIFKAVHTILSKVNASSFGLLAVALFLAVGQLDAQGWVKKIGGSGLDQAEDLHSTRDGGYLLLGFTQTVGGDRIFLTRTDIDGTELWSNTYGTANVHGYKMFENEDGSVLIVGDRRASVQSSNNVFLLKISERGEQLWAKELAAAGNQTARDVIAVSEGGYLLVGFTDETTTGEDDILLSRVDENGEELWSKKFGQDSDDRGFGLAEVADGYVFTGVTENENGADNDIITIKVDKAGSFLWERKIATSQAEEAMSIVATSDQGVVIAGYQGNNSDILVSKYHINGDSLWTSTRDNIGLSDQASQIRQMEDGSFLLTGLSEKSVANIDVFVARVMPDGIFDWLKTLGPEGSSDQGVSVDVTLDGGFIIAATSLPLTTLIEDVLLFKTDFGLNTLTNKIEGRLGYDFSALDCESFTTLNAGHPRWIIVAEQGSKQFFGTSDDNGRFNIDVDTGSYTLRAFPYSINTWEGPCPENTEVNFDNQYNALTNVLLPTLTKLDATADLRVDVSAPYVGEGDLIIYDVWVFNEGTAESESTMSTVEIQLDEELTYVRSKDNSPREPESNIEEGFLVYFLQSIPIGGRTRFQIFARAKDTGDDMRTLQAVNVSALASGMNDIHTTNPELTKLPQDLQAEINTLERKVTIRNVGLNPILGPIAGVVIQDDIGFMKEDVGTDLPLDDVIDIPFDSLNFDLIPGRTLRVIATIEGQGMKGFGSDAVEPYKEETTITPYSTGFVSMFPEDDLERNFEIDVQEVMIPSGDFELRGYPKGYRNSVIAPNTDLTYTIFFRNTGTETINRVVVRDTLPAEFFDLTTIIPGASNLPYKFEVDGNGILKFTFEGVNLQPGSSAMIDTSSYGYVKFVVSQKLDLPPGSVIPNRAAVFFDYQSPSTTNEVTHVIGEFPDFIEFQPLTDIDEPYMEGVEIKIYPNPFTNGTTFELKGKELGEVVLRIFNLDGRLIESYQHSGNKFMYYRNHQLPSGMYLYRLESEGQLINSGKLLVR